jgi:Na+(H+)/acetate symporter ActP
MDPHSATLGRQASLSLFILVAAAALAVVLDRVGVGAAVLVALALVLVMGVGTVSGMLAGTMRLPVFLTGGGDLPVAAVGLIVAVAVAGDPRVQPLPAMVALALWALLVAPLLRRTGMPGLPGALGHAFDSAILRIVLSLVVAGWSLLFAASHLVHSVQLIAPMLSLSDRAAVALAGALLALVLVPGGLRGGTRMAVGLGLVSVLAAAAVVAAGLAGGGLTVSGIVAATAVGTGSGLEQGLALAGLVAAPHLAVVASAGRSETVVREGGLWGALSAILITAALIASDTSKAPSGLSVLLPMASAGAGLAVDLATAGLLLHAAATALGYDLRGPLDRRRHSTSKRFATLRLATFLSILAACWLALSRPSLVAASAGPATAILVGGLGPALLLAMAARAPGRWGGVLATATGLATTVTLLSGQVVPAWLPEAAGFAGLAAGLLAGVLPTVLARRPEPPMAMEEGAL